MGTRRRDNKPYHLVQGVGGAMLTATTTAIITNAFPARQRGIALGVNQVAGLAGSFIGLALGGLLSAWSWRAIFWVNVGVGVVGAWWAYRNLRETAAPRRGAHRLVGTRAGTNSDVRVRRAVQEPAGGPY